MSLVLFVFKFLNGESFIKEKAAEPSGSWPCDCHKAVALSQQGTNSFYEGTRPATKPFPNIPLSIQVQLVRLWPLYPAPF
jgi:Rieske Fe-S protein